MSTVIACSHTRAALGAALTRGSFVARATATRELRGWHGAETSSGNRSRCNSADTLGDLSQSPDLQPHWNSLLQQSEDMYSVGGGATVRSAKKGR